MPSRRIPPLVRALPAAIALVAALVSSSFIPARAATTTPTSIVPFLDSSRTGEVVVPNGTYTGGVVRSPHSDWLVLRAETPGGVTVDLATTGLSLEDPTSKVVFVGFKFVNGMTRIAGVTDVQFWYCDFSFPAEEWTRQYRAIGGTTPATRAVRDQVTRTMTNPYPTALRIRQGILNPAKFNQGLGIYGSDFHDIGDDGIFFGFSNDVRIAGVRIWDTDDHGLDPGEIYGNSGDWWHNDAIQSVGGISNVEVNDSWAGQKIQWGGEDRDISRARLQRLWIAGSRTVGQIAGVKPGGRILTNAQDEIRAFGNGQGGGTYQKGLDRFRIDVVDGVQMASWPSQYSQIGRFEVPATRVDTSVPQGVTVRNGLLTDITQVRDHPQNPANLWRAAHPYGSFRGTLGLPGAGTTPTTTVTVAPTPTTVAPTTTTAVPTTPTTAAPPTVAPAPPVVADPTAIETTTDPSPADSRPAAPSASSPVKPKRPASASIVDYLSSGETGEVVVPNGTYTGGTVRAPHGDWLVLRAETPGGVTVDLAETGLKLDDGTSKVVFVGFRFVNGMVRLSGVSDVQFWYCDFSFTPQQWTRQYKAAGGRVPATRAVRDRMVATLDNAYPTALRIRQGVIDRSLPSRRIGVFGSDIHDVADDGIFVAFTEGLRISGVRIWNVHEKGLDPGRSFGSAGDWWNGDGITTDGALRDVVISDTWSSQEVQWSATDGRDIVGARLQRVWLAGSTGFGHTAGVRTGGRILASSEDEVRAFGNGQAGRYDRSRDGFRNDFVDGTQRASSPRQYFERGRFEIPATRIDTSVPPGVTVRSGLLTDLTQVREHVANPANLWRAAHPYGVFRTDLGLPAA